MCGVKTIQVPRRVYFQSVYKKEATSKRPQDVPAVSSLLLSPSNNTSGEWVLVSVLGYFSIL